MNENLFHAGESNTSIRTVVPTFFIPIPFHKRLLLISLLLMSYVGCTGTLMAETDLVEVVNSTFGGFPKTLHKKSFPRMNEV